MPNVRRAASSRHGTVKLPGEGMKRPSFINKGTAHSGFRLNEARKTLANDPWKRAEVRKWLATNGKGVDPQAIRLARRLLGESSEEISMRNVKATFKVSDQVMKDTVAWVVANVPNRPRFLQDFLG